MSNGQLQQGIVMETCSVEYMLAHMLRSQQVFNIAAQWLQPTYFNQPGETMYRMIWAAATAFFAEYNMLPPQETLASTVISQMLVSPDCDQQLIDETQAFLQWAFPPAFADDQLVPAYAIDLIKSFMIERRVANSLQSAFQAGVPINHSTVPALVETAYQQIQQLSSIQNYTRRGAVPMEWEEVAAPTIRTNVPIIDENMNGGTEPREVHVILGPTGVGKTTLGMQIVCSMARLNYTNVTEGVAGATRKLHVFISYEDARRSMVVRALAFTARIDKTRLEQMGSYNELTRRGNLLPYELQMLSRHEDPPGEYERMCEAREWLNDYCEFADFSGSRTPGEPVRGYGGIAEIRQYLDAVIHATGLPIGVVAIDWAGRCVRRYITAKGGDMQRQQTTMLSEFVGQAFDHIAAPLNCPVFIMHQIKGAAGKSPTKELTHHDAEACSTFAINAWFAFVLGNKDEKTHTCLFQVTKTRRGEAAASQICLINGKFSEIVDSQNRYKIDRVSNSIVLSTDADRVDSNGGSANTGVIQPLRQNRRTNVDQGFLDG